MLDDRPTPIRYGRIDCMGSIERSIEHTKVMLFRPFDLNKWIAMGVIIFLSVLGTGGTGYSFNFQGPGPGGPGGQPLGSLQEAVEEARAFVSEYLREIVLYGSLALLVLGALMILITWLGARGRLMLVRAVALNDARIGVNWTEAGKRSASLFWFSIALVAVSWAIMLALAAVTVLLLLNAVDAGAESFDDLVPTLLWPLLVFLIYLAVTIPVWLLLNDFVVPVMYRFNVSILPAWRIVLGMIRGNILTLTLFYVIRFVIAIVKGVAIMLAGCLTCCVGFVPVVSQALTAPVHVFDRAFSMFALQSMSHDFFMIAPTEPENPDPFESSGGLDGY